ncbi:MAG: hypothetical protein JO302_03605, partial [Candidatus Eremiobacteraeota bacterium]|nr:hypothetical protein [Candidatus Eremiobacteraeota bacterium]
PYESLNAPSIEAEQLDGALFEQLAAFLDGRANPAFDFTTAIAAARTDLEVHSTGPRVDAAAVPQVVRDDLMNGWDVRLYVRPWAERYAEKLFAAFTADGTLDEEAGMRYRSEILSPARRFSLATEVSAFLRTPAQLDMP